MIQPLLADYRFPEELLRAISITSSPISGDVGFLPFGVENFCYGGGSPGLASESAESWPVDFTVDNLHKELPRRSFEASGTKRMPFIWFWPDGASGCLILTHDVETAAGRDFTFRLIDLDESYGFRPSYQVIPEQRCELPDAYVCGVRSRGCEFNIHDINHDACLYSELAVFLRQATKEVLPDCNLIRVCNCSIHLSFESIFAALRSITQSEIGYLLTTHHADIAVNVNIETGSSHALNLSPPFNFPLALELIDDYGEGLKPHQLGLWRVADLPYPAVIGGFSRTTSNVSEDSAR